MDIRVVIFDDNRTRRDGVSLLLNTSDGYACVGAFEDFAKGLEQIEQLMPDVIIMDIDMPGINGIEAVTRIKSRFPEQKVMMQTVFDTDDKVFESILAGASGYLLKKASPVKLLESIREIHEGGSPMTPEIATKVLQFFRTRERQRGAGQQLLTAKEQEVLSDLVNGLSYKMIADQCNVSLATINTHIRHIYEKLQVNSGTEAVAKAIEHQIVNSKK